MKKNTRYLIIIFLLILGGGYLVLRGGLVSQPQAPGSQTKVPPSQVSGSFTRGQKAPDVTLVDFDGKTHNLSDLEGRAVVLDFWAAWCPFCLEEMPELQEAQDNYGEKLVMIGVHRTDTESKDVGLKFARDRGVSYLLVADADGSLYRAAGGFGMPTAVFIDPEGVVSEIKSGPKTKNEIEEKISELFSNE